MRKIARGAAVSSVASLGVLVEEVAKKATYDLFHQFTAKTTLGLISSCDTIMSRFVTFCQ
jgi:hypothetical protein